MKGGVSMRKDYRARLTKMLIRDKFLQLLKEKPINKITVSEICVKAEINRATFYAHYKNVYDLLESIEGELTNGFEEALQNKTCHIEEYIMTLLQVIKDNSELCSVLITDKNSGFVQKIMDMGREYYISGWMGTRIHASDEEVEFVYDFLSHGSVGVICEWLENGMNLSLEELAAFLSKLSNGSLSGFTDEMNA